MKPLPVFAATIVVLSATACQDRRVTPLEERVSQLELKVKALEEEKAKAADEKSQKDSLFKTCVQTANDEYYQEVKVNGVKMKNGGYDLPVATAHEIDRRKQQKIEECRLLYR